MLFFDNGAGNTSGILLGPFSVSADETLEVDYEWTTSAPGDYSLTVTVDPLDEVTEINESDNVGSAFFTVGERLPLNWTHAPDEGPVIIREGESVNISASVTRGKKVLTGEWILDGRIVGRDTVFFFEADYVGENSSVGSPYTIEFVLDEGQYHEGETTGAAWEGPSSIS